MESSSRVKTFGKVNLELIFIFMCAGLLVGGIYLDFWLITLIISIITHITLNIYIAF
jgi:hypothetical protein